MSICTLRNKRTFLNPKSIGTILILSILLFATCTIAVKGYASPPTVPLVTAAAFSVLAGSGITNTGATTIYGDIGTYPTNTETGFGTIILHGTNHVDDAFTQAAKTDLLAAYNNAAGRTPDYIYPPIQDLGGLTLTPGIYNDPSSFAITGTLILDGGGDSNAVFIFQAGSTLTTVSSSVVILINGAQARNVFWQVGSSATIGTGSTFVGNILALTSITVTTGATVDGRALALNGAVTLDGNTIGVEEVILVPASNTTPTGNPYTVTATVTGTGNPMVGKIVTFKIVSGPNVGQTSTVMTDSNGQASFTYTSSVPGTDTIESSFVNSQGATVTSKQVTKTWTPSFVVPESALGALTAIGVCFAAFAVVKLNRAKNKKQ